MKNFDLHHSWLFIYPFYNGHFVGVPAGCLYHNDRPS